MVTRAPPQRAGSADVQWGLVTCSVKHTLGGSTEPPSPWPRGTMWHLGKQEGAVPGPSIRGATPGPAEEGYYPQPWKPGPEPGHCSYTECSWTSTGSALVGGRSLKKRAKFALKGQRCQRHLQKLSQRCGHEGLSRRALSPSGRKGALTQATGARLSH